MRPCRFRPGFRSPLAQPERVDFVIVRENLEDLYLFVEGEIEDLAPLGLDCRGTALYTAAPPIESAPTEATGQFSVPGHN